MDGTAVLRVTHHITKREEYSAQEYHAQEEPNQMTALENPIAAAAFAASCH
jgi:hypothetical protein